MTQIPPMSEMFSLNYLTHCRPQEQMLDDFLQSGPMGGNCNKHNFVLDHKKSRGG